MATKEQPTNQALEASVAAANASLDDVDQGFEGFEEEEPEEAAAPAAAYDPLDAEVPAEKLSGYWKNKSAQSGQPVRFRDLMISAETAEDKIRQQGETANTAREEARVLRAQMQVLMESVNAQRQPARAPLGYADVNIQDPANAMLNNPEQFGRATADLGARIATQQLGPQLNALLEKVNSIEQKGQLLDIRSAAEDARQALGIDRELWMRRGPFLYAAATMQPGGPSQSDSWIAAARSAEEAWPTPEARTTLPREGIVRGNPSGSSRPTPIQKPGQPKQRVRGLVNAVTDDAVRLGFFTQAQAEDIKQKTEDKLRRREGKD